MDIQERIKARWKLINRLFLFIILFVLVVLAVREYQTFRDSVEYFNQTSYDNHVHEIQHEVDNRVEEINSVQEEIFQDFHSSLEAIVKDVDFFASKVLESSTETLTLEEKREIYIDTIYQYDIQEDEYLFFAMDLNGVSYLSGLTKNLEGTDITYLQDVVTGDFFVLNMIDIINESPDNQGFIDYYWMKEAGGEHLKKTSFLYYNEDVDLFIGTGVYEVDYIKSVQDELLRRISSYYSGTEDYIYVMGFNGEVVFHPMEGFETENLLEIETSDGDNFHEYVLEGLQQNEYIVFDYVFEYTGVTQTKTAYIREIEEWEMYIGRSFVFDDLKLEQEKYFQSVIWDYIIFNIFTIFTIIGLVFVLKKLININFNDTESVFLKQNEKIKEISYRDQLTGIYNRKYFDSIEDEICMECNTVTALMLDANSLKLINDTYGHQVGDELLILLVEVTKKVFPEGIHIRWGGDEFVIFVFDMDQSEIKEKVQEFHRECSNNEVKDLKISASIGYATSTPEDVKLYDLINKAETMMYDNKTHESLSTKRKIIDHILNTLYNNFSFEEKHSENVKKYSLMIGKELNLDKEEMNKLRLAALMHDVGKIGVSDKILSKSVALTQDEFDEVKKHPEKGMRILAAYPELSEFGNYALTHHERFDGTGYPRGLKGQDIPLYSRIICIADAFDAMTSDRVYKKRLTKKKAIEELLNNKGTQFDPKLVDIFVNSMNNKLR